MENNLNCLRWLAGLLACWRPLIRWTRRTNKTNVLLNCWPANWCWFIDGKSCSLYLHDIKTYVFWLTLWRYTVICNDECMYNDSLVFISILFNFFFHRHFHVIQNVFFRRRTIFSVIQFSYIIKCSPLAYIVSTPLSVPPSSVHYYLKSIIYILLFSLNTKIKVLNLNILKKPISI